MCICIIGTCAHVLFHMYNMVLVFDKKAEMRGDFLPNFQESLILAYIHIIGTSDVPNV